MIRKLFIITFVFIVFCKTTFAQYRIDCIYSKNGNIYKGNITQKTIDSIRLLTISGNSIAFANKEIDSITKGNKRTEIRNYKRLVGNEHGGFNLVEPALRFTWFNGFGAGLSYYRGYKFKPNFSLALGAGFMYKESNDDTYTYYNQYRLSGIARYDFPTKGDYPFISFEGGVQRIFSDPKLVRAPFWHSAAGYCFTKRNGRAVLLSLGLTQNMVRYTAFDPDYMYTPRKIYYSDWYYQYDLVFKLGFRL